jgi:hypothetical protein
MSLFSMGILCFSVWLTPQVCFRASRSAESILIRIISGARILVHKRQARGSRLLALPDLDVPGVSGLITGRLDFIRVSSPPTSNW